LLIGQLVCVAAEKDIVGRTPTSRQILRAMISLSPVRILTRSPERRNAAIAILALSFGGSRKAI
jgi:hypothetical protein